MPLPAFAAVQTYRAKTRNPRSASKLAVTQIEELLFVLLILKPRGGTALLVLHMEEFLTS